MEMEEDLQDFLEERQDDQQEFNFENSQIEVMISAIEHYSYCPRQFALIHIEQVYEENFYTIQGLHVHERVDSGEKSSGKGVKVLRSIPLWSQKYGLRGKADLVEFQGKIPYPVEYKLGKRKGQHADLQLCAQALCLEEMLKVDVPRGAIFQSATRERIEIELDATLRQKTLQVVSEIRELLRTQRLPNAPNDQRCRNCSLTNSCLPAVLGEPNRLRGLQGSLFHPYGDKE